MGKTKPLTALEASFLGLESPGVPLHVAGLTVFEGHPPITLDELHEMLGSRLRLLPRFRQRLSDSPLGLRRPQWTSVRRPDLDAHLFHHRLSPPGRMRDLFELAARIHETPLRRDRPLWEMHLIDGVEERRQASLLKTHHAITDGLAGIEIAEVLFDPPEGVTRPSLPKTRFAGVQAPGGWAAAQSLLGLAFYAVAGPLVLPGPFNGSVSRHRNFGAVSLPMEAVRRAKRQLGGSIDDVIVATVAAGLHRYLAAVAYPEIPHALRAMLPVSTRASLAHAPLGNHVSSIFVDLPTQSGEVAELLPVISHRKAILRSAHAANGGSLMVETAGLLPAPLHRSVLQLVSALPIANLVLSDVPGPDVPLRLLGRRIVFCYPLMPLTRNIGLSIATISLAGRLGIGVTADPDLVPSAQRVANSIGRAFTAFESTLRARAPQHRRAA